LVAASAVAHDIYSKMLKQSLSHEKILFVSRLTVFLLGVGAMFIALGETRVIFWFVLFAWSGLGASFGPLILFTLCWKKTTQQGAVAGMLTGFVTTLVWKITGLSDSVIYELVPAFILSSLAIYLVSRKTF
jgi:Na+/proline symporter